MIKLGYVPRDWQLQCHQNKARFSVYAVHRRAGKTEMAIMELINSAMKFTLDSGLFVYIAPLLKQSKSIAWTRLKKILEPIAVTGAYSINESELSITFKRNGAQIRLFGGDNFDALRGVRLDGAVIDEVAQIRPELWQDVVQPALSDRQGWALFIGTPNGINLFSQLYYRALQLPEWHAQSFTVYDTQALPVDEVARLRRDMSEKSFAREYLCDFAAAGSDQLISVSDIEASWRRVITVQDIAHAPVILGVDPARFGDDRSVIQRRQGLAAFDPIYFSGMDNMRLASRVAQEIQDHKPDAVFIDAGNGSGVIDRLRQMGHSVVEVPFGGRPTVELYKNKRAEMWHRVRDWIAAGGMIPNLQELKQDLAGPTYFHDPADKLCLESKDDLKARGLPSPDFGDALALTFSDNVIKRPQLIAGQHISSYDPLSMANVLPTAHTSEYVYGDKY